MPHFAVTYAYADRLDDLEAHRPEHRAFLSDLNRQGDLVVSGPYVGPPNGGRGALLIVLADDAETAARILADDPFALAGLITETRVQGWDPVIGSLA